MCCPEEGGPFDVNSIQSKAVSEKLSLSLSLSLYLSCCYLGLPRVYPKLRHVVRLRHPLSLALLLVRVEACQGGGWGPSHPSHHVNSITGIYGSPGYTEDLDTVPVVPEEQESVKFPVRLRGEATYWWYKG